jgi:hypothetical protein
MRIRKMMSIFVWFGSFAFFSSALAQATWVVDADGGATAADCNESGTAFTTIQSAIIVAAPGDTVFVCPGTYNEQIVIDKDNLTLQGAGVTSILKPSAVNVNSSALLAGTQMRPIVLAQASGIQIRNLEIDGSLADSGSSFALNCPVVGFYLGVYFRGGGGSLSDTHITGIESAVNCGHGVRAEQALVMIANSRVDHYSDNGVSCVGILGTCTIIGNTIRGNGPVANQIQTGIQIRAGAKGLIRGNTVADHFLIGANGVQDSSVGIFLVYADPKTNPHIVVDNIFSNNQFDIQRVSSEAAF